VSFEQQLGSTLAVLEGQITIVREATSHEKTGAAGDSCALTASVARLFHPTARTGDLAETRQTRSSQARKTPN
jgi:hypothetical protein